MSTSLREPAPRPAAMRDVVGSAPAFVQQLDKLPSLAACHAGVLILGETGTGKEVFARAVHYRSARAARTRPTRGSSWRRS